MIYKLLIVKLSKRIALLVKMATSRATCSDLNKSEAIKANCNRCLDLIYKLKVQHEADRARCAHGCLHNSIVMATEPIPARDVPDLVADIIPKDRTDEYVVYFVRMDNQAESYTDNFLGDIPIQSMYNNIVYQSNNSIWVKYSGYLGFRGKKGPRGKRGADDPEPLTIDNKDACSKYDRYLDRADDPYFISQKIHNVRVCEGINTALNNRGCNAVVTYIEPNATIGQPTYVYIENQPEEVTQVCRSKDSTIVAPYNNVITIALGEPMIDGIRLLYWQQ